MKFIDCALFMFISANKHYYRSSNSHFFHVIVVVVVAFFFLVQHSRTTLITEAANPPLRMALLFNVSTPQRCVYQLNPYCLPLWVKNKYSVNSSVNWINEEMKFIDRADLFMFIPANEYYNRSSNSHFLFI